MAEWMLVFALISRAEQQQQKSELVFSLSGVSSKELATVFAQYTCSYGIHSQARNSAETFVSWASICPYRNIHWSKILSSKSYSNFLLKGWSDSTVIFTESGNHQKDKILSVSVGIFYINFLGELTVVCTILWAGAIKKERKLTINVYLSVCATWLWRPCDQLPHFPSLPWWTMSLEP